jgi:hypothetical protein
MSRAEECPLAQAWDSKRFLRCLGTRDWNGQINFRRRRHQPRSLSQASPLEAARAVAERASPPSATASHQHRIASTIETRLAAPKIATKSGSFCVAARPQASAASAERATSSRKRGSIYSSLHLAQTPRPAPYIVACRQLSTESAAHPLGSKEERECASCEAGRRGRFRQTQMAQGGCPSACYSPSTISVSRRANARDIASTNRKTALTSRIFILSSAAPCAYREAYSP